MSNRYFYVFFERYVGEEWVAVERSTIFPEHLVHQQEVTVLKNERDDFEINTEKSENFPGWKLSLL